MPRCSYAKPLCRVLISLIAPIAALAFIVPANAQPVADHLKCYRAKDSQPKASYTADLGGLVAEPGCTIKVPGRLLCVEATKTNVAPNPPGGADNSGAPGRFLCYKVKCPTATITALQWHDQFGTRTVTPSTPKIVCAPEILTIATTTTTSTTTAAGGTTTSTPPPPCGSPGEACCGSTCGGGGCCQTGVCLASGEAGGAGTVCDNGSVVTCGGTGQPCCQSNTCNSSRCCVAGTCVANGGSCGGSFGTCSNGSCGGCGGNGQPCCDGNPNGNGDAANFCTASGLVCGQAGTCTACGGAGQPCCANDLCDNGGCCDHNTHACVAQAGTCSAGQGTCSQGACQGGTCGACGGFAEPCCAGSVECTAAYSTCSGGTCVTCGGAGQGCCPAETGGGDCGESFVCDLATTTCVACGSIGEDCCAGAVCRTGACIAATNKCP